MKKVILCIAVLFCFVTVSPASYADNSNTEVHVTYTGDCYHKAGCGSLRSDIPVTLRYAAENGYLPCSRCNPPRPDFEYSSNTVRKKSDPSSGEKTKEENLSKTPYSGTTSKKEENSYPLFLLFMGIIFGPVVISWICCGMVYGYKKLYYTKLYSGKSMNKLCDIPPKFEVGSDGLPRDSGAGNWGKSFTRYVTKSGRRFHEKQGCCGATTEINIANAIENRLLPCSKCISGPIPQLTWYWEYRKIKRIKNRYKIH